MDFGGGNCGLSNVVCDKLKISECYCADIPEWMEKKHSVLKHKFLEINKESGKIPIESDKFELVTVMHVFHYINQLNKSIAELKRVMKSNSILVILIQK